MNVPRIDVFPPLSTPHDDHILQRLHGRLEHDAADAGILDVSYTTIDSPLGTLLLAATARGLVRVAFSREDHDSVLVALADKLGPRVLRSPRLLDTAARQIDEYFSRRRMSFDLTLDLSMSSGFRHMVQSRLSEIAYGATRSYREVAELVGRPRAVRAVGTACATNPLPIVVPCHRVVRTDGGLGGYIGGFEAKSTLLELEAVA